MDVNREHKTFWVWHNNRIFQAEGYLANNGQQEYNGRLWWFPDLGYTLWLDTHCFIKKEDAVKKAKQDLKLKIAGLKMVLGDLEVVHGERNRG